MVWMGKAVSLSAIAKRLILCCHCTRSCKHTEDDGVTAFVVGHYGNFDYLAAKAVITAKQLHRRSHYPCSYLTSRRAAIKTPKGLTIRIIRRMEDVPVSLPLFAQIGIWSIMRTSWLPRHPASNARELVEYAERGWKRDYQVTNLRPLHRNAL